MVRITNGTHFISIYVLYMNKDIVGSVGRGVIEWNDVAGESGLEQSQVSAVVNSPLCLVSLFIAQGL